MLADRYKLVDLLNESGNGRFWRAHDDVLDRHVALHCIAEDDERAAGLTEAARLSATVLDRRFLRVLDADHGDGMSYVVNEWGDGTSLDILVGNDGPLPPRRAAWVVSEVAASVAAAHEERVAHGRLVPENVLLDHTGSVRIIGFCVDAALRGLPPGRISQDVTDLGGLLYFALTGKWAGSSSSAVPAAPRTTQNRWLRPRQVRAGIPRVLDGICDVVLNPYAAAPAGGPHNLLTAAGLADALRAYVGDPTGLAEASPLGGVHGAGALAVPGPRAEPDPDATRAMTPPSGPVADPDADTPADSSADPPPATSVDEAVEPTLVTELVAPEADAPAPAAADEPAGGPDDHTDVGAARPPAPVDQPTQAGMPIFGEGDDDVDWFSARHSPPPPPPPLEDPPERPLFAPEPADGAPTRRPRPGSRPAAQKEYWPWDTATGSGTGSGVIPVTEDDRGRPGVPGRSWFRLAAIIGASLLLVLAVLVAYNLGRGKTPLGSEPEPESPSPSASESTPAAQPLEVASVRYFDPQGDPPFEENPELAPLAVDGDPATAWRTQTYFDQFGPGGLKTGIGLVLDLGESQEVSQVDLTTLTSPVAVSYYLSDEDPTAVAGLEPAASGRVTGERLRTTFEEPASGRYLVVWITSLAPVDGDFAAEIAEVGVRG